MEKEKIYKIYDSIIRNENISIEKLNRYEITKEELIKLQQENIIEQISEEKYKIKDYKMLYESGVALINNKEYNRGITYLELYYKYDNNHLETKLHLILSYINTKKYQKIFEILDTINNKDINQKDQNLILYLLSIITDYPDKYREKILNIEYKDLAISLEEKLYKNIESHNTMRAYVIQNKFYYANKTYSHNLTHSFPNKTIGKIVSLLILQAKEMEEKRNRILISCINEKNYQSIISIIEKKQQQTQISLTDNLIYKITKDIITITNIKKIPRPTITNANTLEEAIEGRNYYLALKIITERNNIISDKNLTKSITNLLIEINKLIKKVVEEYREKQTTNNNLTKTRKKQ